MTDDYRGSLPVLAERVRSLEAVIPTLVTRDEYSPVRLLVYGMTALMLSGLVGAMIALVLKGAP